MFAPYFSTYTYKIAKFIIIILAGGRPQIHNYNFGGRPTTNYNIIIIIIIWRAVDHNNYNYHYLCGRPKGRIGPIRWINPSSIIQKLQLILPLAAKVHTLLLIPGRKTENPRLSLQRWDLSHFIRLEIWCRIAPAASKMCTERRVMKVWSGQ